MIPKHASDLLEELDKLNYKPRGSEKGLIESVKRNIARDKMLSKGQAAWLQDIYTKAAGGGVYQNKERI